jgi:peptidyl-tRNA hydrolase, PTH1 family
MAKNKLIIGLGNHHSKYYKTRHNVGFWLVDDIATKYQISWQNNNKFKSDIARMPAPYENTYLIKPCQFMNNNGISIGKIAQFYKIATSDIFICYDDLDLKVGCIKLKEGGGSGGHNGLKSTFFHLGKKGFWRLRIGIDHPGDSSLVTEYVLSAPNKDQNVFIKEKMQEVTNNIELLLNEDYQKFMRLVH